MAEQKRINVNSLMTYASHWMLKLAGSMLVLSFAVNNISQLDDIADAYAKVIVLEAEGRIKVCPAVSEKQAQIIYKTDESLVARVEYLETMAHKPSINKRERE